MARRTYSKVHLAKAGQAAGSPTHCYKQQEHELQHEDDEHDDEDHDQDHSISIDDDDGEGTTPGGYGHGGLHGHRPLIETVELVQDFSKQPQSDMHHYFVTSVATDPEVARELGGLDPNMDASTSITIFFTLLTMRRQRQLRSETQFSILRSQKS
jgi:hypothetical protein